MTEEQHIEQRMAEIFDVLPSRYQLADLSGLRLALAVEYHIERCEELKSKLEISEQKFREVGHE